MRLLKYTPDGGLSLTENFINDKKVPPYAILSHTWEDEHEVTFDDLSTGDGKDKAGYNKILFCARQAQRDGLHYCWVDTCCIDKASSAELSEAINSMYAWYENAQVCYAYLADVPSNKTFQESRWFTRGWTLQELVAPTNLVFLDEEWSRIGTKIEVADMVSSCTSIPEDVLLDKRTLETYSIAQRMSWAAGRKTTRVEDEAYCLMGMFEINMPLICGEGRNAFIRLQEEIMKNSDDHSLFAWQSEDDRGGCLATSPASFRSCSSIVRFDHLDKFYEPPSVSSRGIQLELRFIGFTPGRRGVAILDCCEENEDEPIAIYVQDQSFTLRQFKRIECNKHTRIPLRNLDPSQYSVRKIFINKGRITRQGTSPGTSNSTLSTDIDWQSFLKTSHRRSAFEALLHAIKPEKNDELWLFLTRADVEINMQYKGGRTALSYAASEGDESSMRMLLCQNGVHVNLADETGRTPASWAAGNGKTALVKLLLKDVKVHIDKVDTTGRTPLSWAAANGHKAIADLLIDSKKVDVDTKDFRWGRTPLIWAAMEGQETVVKLLLETGNVDVNASDTQNEEYNEGGRTSLVWAARNGHEEVVNMLLRLGNIEVDKRDIEWGQTPLSWAAEKGHEKIVKKLLNTGKVEVDKKDTKVGRTPLIWAAMEGHDSVVKLLLETGKVEVNEKDKSGRTSLVWAAINGHEMVVKTLLETGEVDINAKDAEHGWTPLMWATEKEHRAVVRLLNSVSF